MINSKKIILVLALFILSANVFSQSFTIDYLRKLNELSMEDFKKEMKEVNNFSYYDKTESTEFTLYEYNKFENDQSSRVGKFEYVNDKTLNSVEYSVTDKKIFVDTKTLIIKLGYKLTGTGKILGGGQYADYKLKNYYIRLVTPKSMGKNAEYTIIVNK
jgi:hypothetical protein